MRIFAQAPTRIDLAGGTLDLPPLFLLHGFGLTVNIAINFFAKVELSENKKGVWSFKSWDLGREVKYKTIKNAEPEGFSELFLRVTRFFDPDGRKPVDISTDLGELPKGTGLAASSALIIALCGAFNKLTHRTLNYEQLLNVAKNLETQLVRVPTGFQDYYPAIYGGLNIVWFEVSGNRREVNKISSEFLARLQKNLILCYTGEPHFSGTNNWRIFKDHIDGKKKVIQTMEAIKQTALKMRKGILAGGYNLFAETLTEDWENRKKLSPGVSTPRIEKLISKAKEKGSLAARVCGAGGGGCMVVLAKDGQVKPIKEVLQENGGRVLEYRFDYEGLKVDAVS